MTDFPITHSTSFMYPFQETEMAADWCLVQAPNSECDVDYSANQTRRLIPQSTALHIDDGFVYFCDDKTRPTHLTLVNLSWSNDKLMRIRIQGCDDFSWEVNPDYGCFKYQQSKGREPDFPPYNDLLLDMLKVPVWNMDLIDKWNFGFSN